MVGGHPALLFVRPLKLGEVDDEQHIVFVPAQVQLVGQIQPQAAQHLAHRGQLIGTEQQEVTGLGVHRFAQPVQLLLGEVLGQGRALHAAVLVKGQPSHAFCAQAQGLVGQPVDEVAGEVAVALHVDAAHNAARLQRLGEHTEPAFGGNVAHFYNGQVKAQVGLVAAVHVHGLGPGHPHKGLFQIEPLALFRGFQVFHQILEQLFQMNQHVLLVHKAHLHIHLGELRLPVRTQVLIPEAPCHLVIPINAAHHQQLLENLRALGQGVELAVVHPAGHQIIPRALRGGLGEHGGLHREEALAVQIILSALLHPMAEAQPLYHFRTAQVQVAVLQPQLVLHARVIQREGQRVGLADDLQLHRTQFHGAGGQLFVHGLLIAQADGAFHRNHGFIFQFVRRRKFFRRELGRVEHHLQNTFPVPQVHENNAAHIPLGLHPAAGYGGFADVCFPVQAAILGTLQHTLSLQNKKPHIRSSSKSVCGAKKQFRGATHLGPTRQARSMQR